MGHHLPSHYLYTCYDFSGLVFYRWLCSTANGGGSMRKTTIVMLIIAIITVIGNQFGWW